MIKIIKIEQGKYFGEMAIMKPKIHTRNASVQAS